MPSSVRMLMVKPNIHKKKHAPISDTGMVTNGISVERNERRNRKITRVTSTMASTMVRYTALIDASMNSDESNAINTLTPSGSAA